MRDIRTFFASSTVEFRDERVELGNYIRSLDERFSRYGYHLHAVLCEDLSPAVAREGSQKVIDRKIRESQFFYVLVGEDLGEFTEGEFDVALAEFVDHAAPKIYTYFRVSPDGEPSASAARFKRRMKRIRHYRRDFTELAELKLDMVEELAEYALQNAPAGLFLQNAFRRLNLPDRASKQENLLNALKMDRARAWELSFSVPDGGDEADGEDRDGED